MWCAYSVMSDPMLTAEHASRGIFAGMLGNVVCVRPAVELDVCVRYGMDVEDARMNNV